MGSVMDQERPWKRKDYKEPESKTIEEGLKILRENLKNYKPGKWMNNNE